MKKFDVSNLDYMQRELLKMKLKIIRAKLMGHISKDKQLKKEY